MNFEEYLNQTDPKRFPRVDITKEDFYGTTEVVFGKEVGLIIHGKPYVYFVRPGDVHLHTLDSDGNISGMSCFVLDKPLEPKTDAIWPRRWRETKPTP